MLTVNVSSLKNQLSSILKKVRGGEEVLVVDRHQPVARLTAISQVEVIGNEDLLLRDLEKRGIVLRATGKKRSRKWLESHIVKVAKGVSAVRALLKEREEAW